MAVKGRDSLIEKVNFRGFMFIIDYGHVSRLIKLFAIKVVVRNGFPHLVRI